MSPKIVRIAVASIWIVSLSIGFADYPISLVKYWRNNYLVAENVETMQSIDLASASMAQMAKMSQLADFSPNSFILRAGSPPARNFTEELAETIMNEDLDIDKLLLSIVGGPLGMTMNKTTKDRLKKIVSNEPTGWCSILHPTRGWLEFSVMTMTLICFIFLTFCYGHIFKEVFGKTNSAERNTRKLVLTTFLLLGAFTM